MIITDLPTELICRIIHFLDRTSLIRFLICSPALQMFFKSDILAKHRKDKINYVIGTGVNKNQITIIRKKLTDQLMMDLVNNGISVQVINCIDSVPFKPLPKTLISLNLKNVKSIDMVSISECHKLTDLGLSEVKLPVNDLHILTKLSSLTLNKCTNIDVFNSSLGSLRDLTNLTIDSPFQIPKKITFDFPLLEYLNVTISNKTTIKTTIQMVLPSLTYLRITNNTCKHNVIKKIKGIDQSTGLKQLELKHFFVFKKFIKNISFLTRIIHLTLYLDEKVKTLDPLSRLVNLESIDLSSYRKKEYSIDFLRAPKIYMCRFELFLSIESLKAYPFQKLIYLKQFDVYIYGNSANVPEIIDVKNQIMNRTSDVSLYDPDLNIRCPNVINDIVNSMSFMMVTATTLTELEKIINQYKSVLVLRIIEVTGVDDEIDLNNYADVCRNKCVSSLYFQFSKPYFYVSYRVTHDDNNVLLECYDFFFKNGKSTVKHSNDILTKILNMHNYVEYLTENGFTIANISIDKSRQIRYYDITKVNFEVCSTLWVSDHSVILVKLIGHFINVTSKLLF